MGALRWALVGVGLCLAIIVPFVIWEDAVLELSRRWLESSAHRALTAGVVVALLALDVLLPVPSSFVSAGAVSALGGVLGTASIWLGMSAGAVFGYALGRSGGTPLVARFVGRGELERARRLTVRFGRGVLVVCRGVPVLAEASVLVAGAAKMGFVTFVWVTSAANLGLALAYTLLSSFGWGGPAAVLSPFVLGIAVPGLAIAIAKRVERRP